MGLVRRPCGEEGVDISELLCNHIHNLCPRRSNRSNIKDQTFNVEIGMSCHCRPWFEHVLNKYSEFEMIIFPCSAIIKVKGEVPTAANTDEVNPGHGSDQTQSIFKAVLEVLIQQLIKQEE